MKEKIAVMLWTEPKWGGEHQYALTLMECLKEIENINLVAVCNNKFWRNWCRENKIYILNTSWWSLTNKEQQIHMRYPLYSRISSMYFSEFGKVIRQEKITVVFGTTQGMFIPNLSVKVIVPVHDLMHRYEGRFPEVKIGYTERELMFSSKAKYARCVLTDSVVGKQQFIESYSSYMRRKKPHVISLPFIVSPHIIQCEEQSVDIPNKYVFYPAQFWKHKNHINLLKAINLLRREIADIHLILVGSEKNMLREVKKYITENELSNNVEIKGFVSDGNIVYLYRHAIGMIMPSYFGPTNIPPLEAMALGCPVAVSNKYGMPEQVGDAGLLFDPDSPEEIAECIRLLWTDDKLRERMICKGYAKVNGWTKREFKNKLQKILNYI
jgi:glycosyltransferase involved in cell wall biosynthesis